MIPAAPLQYVCVMFLNRSWPAVSQICNLKVLSPIGSVFILKSTPMVATQVSLKWFQQKRVIRLVLPTPLSPITITFTEYMLGFLPYIFLEYYVQSFIIKQLDQNYVSDQIVTALIPTLFLKLKQKQQSIADDPFFQILLKYFIQSISFFRQIMEFVFQYSQKLQNTAVNNSERFLKQIALSRASVFIIKSIQQILQASQPFSRASLRQCVFIRIIIEDKLDQAQQQRQKVMKKITRQNLEKKIIESLGYNDLEDEPKLQRARKQLKSDQLSEQLSELIQKSQKKKRKVRENIAGLNPRMFEGTEEMKELEWRLQVLREDRRERQDKKGEPMTFEELYNRQKNKYLKFRDRQRIKISDPKYLQMIGSTQMRRKKRRLDSIERVEKHIQMLDENINNHVEDNKGGRNFRKRAG